MIIDIDLNNEINRAFEAYRRVHLIYAFLRQQQNGAAIAEECRRLHVIERFVEVGRPLTDIYWFVQRRFGIEVAGELDLAIKQQPELQHTPAPDADAVIAVQLLPGLPFITLIFADERERIERDRSFEALGPPR